MTVPPPRLLQLHGSPLMSARMAIILRTLGTGHSTPTTFLFSVDSPLSSLINKLVFCNFKNLEENQTQPKWKITKRPSKTHPVCLAYMLHPRVIEVSPQATLSSTGLDRSQAGPGPGAVCCLQDWFPCLSIPWGLSPDLTRLPFDISVTCYLAPRP